MPPLSATYSLLLTILFLLNFIRKPLLFNSIFSFHSTFMPKLHIETGDDNIILRNISEPFRIDEIRKYRTLAEQMVRYIKNPDNGGVGLAAPQVGVNKRLIVVSLMRDYDDEDYRTIPLFNPVITEHSEEKCTDKE